MLYFPTSFKKMDFALYRAVIDEKEGVRAAAMGCRCTHLLCLPLLSPNPSAVLPLICRNWITFKSSAPTCCLCEFFAVLKKFYFKT